MSAPPLTTPAVTTSRNRGIGAVVGSLIGGVWGCYAATQMGAARPLVIAIAVVISAVLAFGGYRLGQRRGAPGGSEMARAQRRAWLLFWLNLVGEIVLLNLIVMVLDHFGLRDYWIAGISLIVGLHFLPLERIFTAPVYRWTAAAMILGAALASAALYARAITPVGANAAEALANAVILWATAATGLVNARRSRQLA